MASQKQKYYVVWCGTQPGIYRSWAECEQQVKGVAGAKYKAYATPAEAEAAYAAGAPTYPSRPTKSKTLQAKSASQQGGSEALSTMSQVRPAMSGGGQSGLPANPPEDRHDTVLPLPREVTADAWAVDAACSGNPGAMEYRGVDLATGAEVFHYGPILGTNNIGEFLAIVHALSLMQRERICKTIYSDSRNALNWVRKKKCNTKLPRTKRSEQVHALIERAESWLAQNDCSTYVIKKWETNRWGEIPADFGRKK